MTGDELQALVVSILVDADATWRTQYGAAQISPARLRFLAEHVTEAVSARYGADGEPNA